MSATSTFAVAAPQTSDECRVLIVDDDRDFADGLADFLNLHGYRAEVAYDADEALARCETLEPGIAIFDIRLGVGSGLDLMQRLQDQRPELLSIAATGYANIETAIEAIRKGAYDYLRKPLHNDEILIVLERGFERLRLEENKRTAEEALQMSEERFRDFAEASADWFWATDAEHHFTYVSANFERIMGVPVASVLGRTRLQIRTDTGDEEAWRQHLETLHAHRPFRDFTFLRVADAESPKWASVSGVPRFTENGHFLGYRGVGSDVTNLKQAEAALRAERTRLDTILDLAPDAIVVMDREFRIRVFGQGAVRTFGYTSDEALGQPIEMLIPPRFRDRHRHHVQAFAGVEATTRSMNERGEIVGLRKDGGEFPAEASISKLEFGDEVLFTVILRDATERKQREEQLR